MSPRVITPVTHGTCHNGRVQSQLVNCVSTPETHQLIEVEWHTHTHIYVYVYIYICVSKSTIVGSDNDLSPGRRQAIICTNDGILLIRPVGTNFNELLSSKFKYFHRRKYALKYCQILPISPRPQCVNATYWFLMDSYRSIPMLFAYHIS